MFRVRAVSLVLLTGAVAATSVNGARAAGHMPDTLFGAAVPRGAARGPARAIEVGVRFRVLAAGRITGIRFYRRPGNRGPHIGSLWNAHGRLLARVRFRHESRSGWQRARFRHPVRVRPGVTYTAGYHAPRGDYSVTHRGLTARPARDPMAVVTGPGGAGGVYRFGRAAALPRHTRRDANFWVDVLFRPRPGARSTGGSGATGPGGATGATGAGATGGTVAATTDCFASPGACGFPDPAYAWRGAGAWQPGGGGVGPTSGGRPLRCSSLPTSGEITTSRDGQVISNLNVSGTIQVYNRNVTIENVCVTNNGLAQLGSDAIKVLAGGLRILNSRIAGVNSTEGSIEQAVTNFGGGTVTLSHDDILNCGECLNTGSWNVSDSYILNNGMYGTDDHLEAIYIDGSGDVVRVTHSTVLEPPGWDGPGAPQGGQAGLFFGDTNGGRGGACSTHWSVTDNLLAGDGVLIYECGNAASFGTAALTFTDNRIAACRGATVTDWQGYPECVDIPGQTGDGSNRAGDGFGYFPNGGLKGTDFATDCGAATTVWSGNLNETTGLPVSC